MNGEKAMAVKYEGGNFLYIVNDDYQVVAYNELMKKLYPQIEKGGLCHRLLMHTDEPCKGCPLNELDGDDVTVYNQDYDMWVNVKRTQLDYPGEGPCYVLICGAIKDMSRSVGNRLSHLVGFDVFIEMNLTKDQYRIIFREDKTDKEFSERGLRDMIMDTANRIIHPEDRDDFLAFWDMDTLIFRIGSSKNEIRGEFRERNKYGEWDLVSIVIVPEDYVGTDDVYVMALYNIIHLEDKTKFNSQSNRFTTDPLTGLVTRKELWRVVDERKAKDGREYCMIVTDIQHFHIFNKWYGREKGDSLLAAMGQFFRKLEEETGAVTGYMGGDNFCTIFSDNESTRNRLIDGVNELLTGFEGADGFTPIFGGYRTADTHMFAAEAYDNCVSVISRNIESAGGKLFWFDSSIEAQINEELDLMPRIQKAIEKGNVFFYLQPKCEIHSGRIIGSEALVRWYDEEQGSMVSPGKFIPILERNGYIAELDCYIWDRVCSTIAGWKSRGIPILPVSVNVSRVDIFKLDVVDIFSSLIKKYNIPADFIEIEITESAYIENEAIIHNVEHGLKEAGFRILIDDFGSGYSSLNMLKDSEVDVLKLDMRFLKLDEHNLKKGENIIASVIEMAGRLNLRTIAEGVETNAQRIILEDMGCDSVQGYYFYKPMPVSEFEALLYDDNIITTDCAEAGNKYFLDSRMRNTELLPMSPAKADYTDFPCIGSELIEYMNCLKSSWDLCRLVDVRSMTEYTLDEGGSSLSQHYKHCYDIWSRGDKCSNCISKQAVHTNAPHSKFEILDKHIFYVTARPVRIGGAGYSLETAIEIKNEQFYTVFGRKGFSEALKRYSDGIYLDTLTGAYNRSYYIEQVNWTGVSALAMIDLDNFREVNRKWGHQTGDMVLKTCAGVIMDNIGENDILIRYGGDKFLLVIIDALHDKMRDPVTDKMTGVITGAEPDKTPDAMSGKVPDIKSGTVPDAEKESFVMRLERLGRLISGAAYPGYPELCVTASIGGMLCSRCTPENIENISEKLLQAKKQPGSIVI